MEIVDLEVGDYVEYRYRNVRTQTDHKARGYVIVFCLSGYKDVVWIGKEKDKITQGMRCVFMPDILRKVPPPQA